MCVAHGFEAVLPGDVAVDERGLSPPATAQARYQETKALLCACDGVVADISPLRGCSMDAGVAFEVGFAAALGIPIVGWTDDDSDYLDRVLAWYRGRLTLEDGRWFDPDGREVEDFGLTDSMMVCRALSAVTCSFDQALLALKGLLRPPLARQA